MNVKSLAVIGLSTALYLAPFPAALAKTNTVFILDGSNSMWGQVDGVAKIALAKRLMSNLLNEIPVDTNIGLMSYGHNRKADCSDVEVLSPIGQGDPEAWVKSLEGIVPTGKTPIALALETAAKQFANDGATNNVVLISDGVATCKRDPCEVAAALTARDINVTIHVVGLDVNSGEREQLQCIARAGGGKYFRADDAEALKVALTETSGAEPPVMVAAPVEEENVLKVVIDKAHLIRLEKDASVVMIANPDIADVAVESSRLVFVIGRAPGETNLYALDADGNEIIQTPVVVIPNPDRQVTVHRQVIEATYSCKPRCASVVTPDTSTNATSGSSTGSSSSTSSSSGSTTAKN